MSELEDLRAEVERLQGEVAHWEHHAWEAGEGFKRAIEGAVRAHEYKHAAEAELRALREGIEALHARRAWRWTLDSIAFGQSEYPDQCGYCRRDWPCETAALLAPSQRRGGG